MPEWIDRVQFLIANSPYPMSHDDVHYELQSYSSQIPRSMTRLAKSGILERRQMRGLTLYWSPYNWANYVQDANRGWHPIKPKKKQR